MKSKKILFLIFLIVLGIVGAFYWLWGVKHTVDVDESALNKNVVKTSKVLDDTQERQIKSVQANVKDSSGIRSLLLNKYKSFSPDATIDWNEKLSLYEVVNGLQVLYVTQNGKNVISGHVYDLQTGLDYTEAKMAEVSKINVKDLPLNKFIEIKNGDGSRVIYVFAYLDQQFKDYYNNTLSNINNVTYYILLNEATPRSDDDDYIRAYKTRIFKDVTCSDNSERELKNFLKPAKYNPITERVENCSNDNRDDTLNTPNNLFKKYKIIWSPTLFLGNGFRYKALPDYQLNQILDSKSNESQISKPSDNSVATSMGATSPNKIQSSKPESKKMGDNS